jgi:hypothetical protein
MPHWWVLVPCRSDKCTSLRRYTRCVGAVESYLRDFEVLVTLYRHFHATVPNSIIEV